MHCLATGLIGLGWAAGLTERRWGRGAVFWLVALALHGAWNFAALTTGLINIRLAGSSGKTASALGGLFSLASLGLLGLLCLIVIVAPAVIPRRLAVHDAVDA